MMATYAVKSKSYAALDALISLGADPTEARLVLMKENSWDAARFLTSTGRVRQGPRPRLFRPPLSLPPPPQLHRARARLLIGAVRC